MPSAINNKRIAKNTIYLYIRTIVVLFVMLYTSRIVLQALGVEDLGIYNLVGGIVALLSFVQSSLSKATSRFLTYELGRNSSSEKLQRVFSISMSIHVIIAILVIILGETIGLYILHKWTVIPSTRIFASNFVYQSSLLIFIIQVIRVPYDSVIIAHENMSVYAYMSIIEAVLQLLMAFFLLHFGGDKLIMYGILMLLITFILFLLYWIYIKRTYNQYKFKFIWERDYSLSILSFSGWSLLGSSTNVATQQGVSLLFNNFVGLIANTALGLATQVNSAVTRFVANFTTAFNPQIIKLCAQKNFVELHLLMNRASKLSFVLIWVMALPLIFNVDFVLHLWLGQVPKYTSEFCVMILICSIIDATTGIYNTAITATGHIKKYQICISISFLCDLFFAYLLLLLDCYPPFVFGSRILTRGIFNMIIGMVYVKREINFDVLLHIKKVWIPILCTVIITMLSMLLVTRYFAEWQCLIYSILTSIVLCTLCTYYIILTHQERVSLKNIVLKNER